LAGAASSEGPVRGGRPRAGLPAAPSGERGASGAGDVRDVPGTQAGSHQHLTVTRRACPGGAWHPEGHRGMRVGAAARFGAMSWMCQEPGRTRRVRAVPGTGRDIAPPALRVRAPFRRDVPEVAWRLELDLGYLTSGYRSPPSSWTAPRSASRNGRAT